MPHDHHGHGHGHHHRSQAGFAPAMALNLGFVVVEVVAGLLAGSVALLADAGHNLSDVLGLALAWGAARLALRPPGPRRTFGWRRATILAALANAMLLLVAVGAIGLESARQLLWPSAVETGPMLWVALLGVALNAGTALLFFRGRHTDLNRRGAFLHLAADAGVSLGVVLGALLIDATGWRWIDGALGLGIAAVILLGTWGLLREAADLALDAVPPGIDPEAVRDFLAAQPGVTDVHHLHIWGLGTTETALTAHLVRPDQAPDDAFLATVSHGLEHRFGIGHATLQVEVGPDCAAPPCLR